MISYNLNKYGLRDSDMKYLEELFEKYLKIQKVVLFGSRANGHYKIASDIDLALYGESVDYDLASQIRFILEEDFPLLLTFDVVAINDLNNSKLKSNIKKNGVVIWERSS